MLVNLQDCKNCDFQVYFCRNWFVKEYYWSHKPKFFVFKSKCENPEPYSNLEKKARELKK